MNIGSIGEFGLIERVAKKIRLDKSVVKGSGDDCAVLSFDKNKYLLATSDMLVEGIDFTLKHDPYLIGRKALAVSISDIAACAGSPYSALVSLGIPKRINVKFIDRLTQGLLKIANKYKINIVGGDISSSDKLILDVSLLGFVKKKNLVLRGGAKIGDIIFVTGSLGGSIKGKHFKFEPRVKEAQWLTSNFRPSSMIDISDGLAQDLSHILKQAKAGALIYEVLIPLSAQAKGLDDALYSGEDFELLFTLPSQDAKKLSKKKGKKFFPIGQITSGKQLKLVSKFHGIKTIKPKGFRHF